MFECLDDNPSMRPIALELDEYFERWATSIYDDSNASHTTDQFDIAEQMRISKLEELYTE